MKLVELLAKEIDKWPEGVVQICQSLVDSELYGENSNGSCIFRLYPESGGNTPISEDDYDYVSLAQWQAERDRQKGGEWKRNRGGKVPVSLNDTVDVKLRCGDIQQGKAHEFIWRHEDCDVAANIMQYRIISQPQAEEVDVKDTTIGTLSYKVEIDTSAATQAIDELSAKWDQIETPFKWRDEVTELNAYIEKFTRERDELINRLSLEGFALIPAMTPVMGVADIDFSDWRNLQEGDIIECGDEGWSSSWRGSRVTVKAIERADYGGSLPVYAIDEDGDDDWGESYTFISRP
jgi:hypothetical protein